MKHVLPMLVAALVCAYRLEAAEVSATLSTNRIHVGDRVTLTITATHGKDERCLVPPIARDPFITVWNEQSRDIATSDETSRRITELTLSSFIPGEHRVVTNPVTVVRADGSEEKVDLPPLLLSVVSILSNPPPALAELKPPVRAPGVDLRKLGATLGLVVLAGLVAALALRWWMNRPRASEAARSIPPHEIALAALAGLRSRGLMEEAQVEPFYVELSAIVRIYLEQRFDLHAPEQTTEEFIRTSSQSSILTTEHRQLTHAFLEQSDLVKFARFAPGLPEMQSALEAAERLVRETTPRTTPGGPP